MLYKDGGPDHTLGQLRPAVAPLATSRPQLGGRRSRNQGRGRGQQQGSAPGSLHFRSCELGQTAGGDGLPILG